jgi:predicted RNase H-like nuclease (RuvC/YqgF family)
MTYTDGQQQQRLDDWFPGLRADMDRLRAGNAELRAALAAAELSLQLIAADNRDLEDAHRRIAELEAKLAAAIARAEAAEAELAEYIAWIDALPRWRIDQAITALARAQQSEVQP